MSKEHTAQIKLICKMTVKMMQIQADSSKHAIDTLSEMSARNQDRLVQTMEYFSEQRERANRENNQNQMLTLAGVALLITLVVGLCCMLAVCGVIAACFYVERQESRFDERLQTAAMAGAKGASAAAKAAKGAARAGAGGLFLLFG